MVTRMSRLMQRQVRIGRVKAYKIANKQGKEKKHCSVRITLPLEGAGCTGKMQKKPKSRSDSAGYARQHQYLNLDFSFTSWDRRQILCNS